MKANTVFIFVLISSLGCASPVQQNDPNATSTSQITHTNPAERESVWNVYHPAPEHPWNRVFRQLYRRSTSDGEQYGADQLDPLLWFDTMHLLTGTSHTEAVQVLDEYLSSHAEELIRDPLQRAMFQRDLWAVFDWLASQTEPHPVERQALEIRLAQIVRRVALSKEEIASLPDNYALAIEAKIHPAKFQTDSSEMAFLPADIFQQDSGWVPLGRQGGPVAMTHTEAFPFFGRSVFLVFVRSPEGQAATLDYIKSLKTEPNPITAIGSEVALVRRMLLIDDQGEIVLSPLVETIQLRHFSPAQSFYEFELDRIRLFAGMAGGLVPKTDVFILFMSHGDVFENSMPEYQATIPQICKACHFEHPPIPNSGNTRSIISYSRQPFSLPQNEIPVLFATLVVDEAQTVIDWKRNHVTWDSLKVLWDRASP